MKGEFILSVPDAPKKRIDCVLAYARGIIVAGEGGRIWPFEVTAHEGQLYRP